MIEKYFIKNELTLKRYRKFKQDKLGVASTWILLVLFFSVSQPSFGRAINPM
jgi:microcin C transport system permease protein